MATAFVLSDDAGRELDLHLARFSPNGTGIPAWASDRVFAPEDLAGVGNVAGVQVRCYSAAMQMRCHTGYTLPLEHARDLQLLHEMFEVEYATDDSRLF